ncbi:MAG: hypothetical protein F4W90_11350 [Gammaproteobacteria bacterium]|nr:hypothetical protein [Gammaproteobacteria bacterium]
MSRSSSKTANRYAELPVDQISSYKHNPRVTRNPEYARIKNSLEKNGLEAPLVVTRKPGAEQYTLQAGGNTRLDIAQSLHDAGDVEFATVPCIVKAWTSELNVLVSHLRENDMRGNLMFIERALGVMAFAKLANDPDAAPISQRELAKQLQEHGYALSQPVISVMDYAVNRLYGLLPTALEHGMGKRQITAIRMLEHCAVKVWDRQCPDERGAFGELFGELVKSCDSVTLDFDELTANVAHEIAVASNSDDHAVQLLLDAERSGDAIELEAFEIVESDVSRKLEEEAQKRPFNLEREVQKNRATAVEACVALAEKYELSDCVEVTLDARFGYFMSELPKRNAQRVQTGMWKLLGTACDQARATKRVLKRLLDPNSRLSAALETSKPSELYTQLASFELFECGDRLFRMLEEDDWKRAVKLIGAYRHLRQLEDVHALNFWKT